MYKNTVNQVKLLHWNDINQLIQFIFFSDDQLKHYHLHFDTKFLQKTLVLTAFETLNLKFLMELVNEKGCDITYLGEIFKTNSSNRYNKNSMYMWYLLTKFLSSAKEEGLRILKYLSNFEEVRTGPYLFGCLFLAVTLVPNPDFELLTYINKNFQETWLLNSKLTGQTVQRHLLNQGFEKEAQLLTIYFAPETRTKENINEDLPSILSKNLCDFEKYILKNKQVLLEIFEDSETLLHIFICSNNFSSQKFVFLVRNGADLHLPNTKRQTFIEKLIDQLKKSEERLSLGDTIFDTDFWL